MRNSPPEPNALHPPTTKEYHRSASRKYRRGWRTATRTPRALWQIHRVLHPGGCGGDPEENPSATPSRRRGVHVAADEFDLKGDDDSDGANASLGQGDVGFGGGGGERRRRARGS